VEARVAEILLEPLFFFSTDARLLLFFSTGSMRQVMGTGDKWRRDSVGACRCFVSLLGLRADS
jgi:hypothetical protein